MAGRVIDSFKMGQIESGIAGGNGVLKIADDETIGGEESFENGFDCSMFFNILF